MQQFLLASNRIFSFRYFTLYTSLHTSLLLSACSSQPTKQTDLLGSLRQKNHQLSGEPISPNTALQESRQESGQKAKELDEVKIITPNMLENDYPSTQFLTGVGYTEDLNLNQAMLYAKEQVAASINSEIESSTTVIVTAGRVTKGNRYTTQSSSKQSMKSVQRVKFKNAELIKIDSQRTGCDDRRCVAVAYIERELLAKDYLADFIPLAQRAKRIMTRCLQLSDAGDTLSFAERYAALETVMSKARSIGRSLEVILGTKRFSDWSDLKTKYDEVKVRQDELNALSPIIIDTQGIADKSLKEVLNLAHQKALLSLGVKTRAFYGGTQACLSQPKGALHYALAGDISKSTLSGIIIYRLNYTLNITACATGQIIVQQPLTMKFSVPKNSTFANSAKERLKLKEKELISNLYKALHLTLPLSKP